MLRVDLEIHPDTNETVVIMTAPEFVGQVLLRPFSDDGLEQYTPIAGESFPRYVDGWSVIERECWNREFSGLGTFQELREGVMQAIKKGI